MACSLKILSETAGVCGCEDEIRKYILSVIGGKCDSICVDSMGNIIAVKKGKSDKYKIMLGTHMDENGFIVSGITDEGYIKFKPVGTPDPRTVISKTVTIGDESIKGVIGIKAVHLQKKSERETAVEFDDLYIDIGENKKEEAQKRVSLGDYIAFSSQFRDLEKNITGKGLTRMGCACLIEAMEAEPAFDTYFVFSTQRHIPCSVPGRGMRAASFGIKPDFALVVDTADACDIYKSKNRGISLGGGAVIIHSDKTSICDELLTAAVTDCAERIPILYTNAVSPAGTSAAAAVQTASYGTKTALTAIPCRYQGAPVSVMNKSDIKAVTDLCTAFITESDVIIDGTIKKTY